MSTKFFTNEGENSLLRKFKGAFEHIANIYAFHAVVGYFRSSGYFSIRAHLHKVPDVKILVGINVDFISAEAKKRGLLFFGNPERTRDEFVKLMQEDIKEANYSKSVEDGIISFMSDVIDKKIQIRVHKTKKLHAKIYIFLPETFNEYSGGEVITGSSNLTDAGLGTHQDSNYEFNVCMRDFDEVKFAEEEFKKLWVEGEEILPIDMDRLRLGSHIGQLFTPFEIYIKLLIEYFGKNIEYDPDSVGDLPKAFKKLSYQVDAVNQGYQMLLDHNGFMLADVVGLGKTVIATMIAKRYLITNGTLNTKILVVYPPHLERNWKGTFRQFGLDKHTRFISNGSLHKIISGSNEDYWPKEDYDLVLVDEAHKFRNHKSQMFNDLQLICKTARAVEGNMPGNQKKVILISATPLNNRPEDIYYQLQLFTDARKSKLSVTNLQSFFAPLIRQYKDVLQAAKVSGLPDVNQLRAIYSRIRDKVLQEITVRRTRRDVEGYSDYLRDLKEQGINFPTADDPKAVEYKMDGDLQDLFFKTIGYLVDSNRIGYYRYQAIANLLPEIQEKYYTNAERASRTLAQIMMTQLVKRLESSFTAFRSSLGNFRISTQRMIEMFNKGKIYVAPDAKINELINKEWSDEEIETYIMELSIDNPRNQIFSPSDFSAGFLENLKQDLNSLTELADEWSKVTSDPKWDVFLHLLKTEMLRKDINPAQKLVIFTESKETAHYLAEKLAEEKYDGVLSVSSENSKSLHDSIQENFDANYSGEWKHEINFIISTEVLAEGINLHRANMIVNYDTPWNATKLMQRIGRINRIGSVANTIYNYAFYPSQQSDDLISLYNNAYIKLQGFHTAFGEDARIYSTQEVLEQVKLHIKGLPEDEDKRLKYLEFIRKFKNGNEKEFKRIKSLPLKSRTARDPELSKKFGVSGASLVFLKSSYKMEFFKVTDNGTIEPLNFVAAAELFEATRNEFSIELPQYHHKQIQQAVFKFEEDLLSDSSESMSGDHKDGNTNRALKFLRGLRMDSADEKFRESCGKLIELLEKGTIANLSMEMRSLQIRQDKNEMKVHQVENVIIQLAAKYITENEPGSFPSSLPFDITEKPQIIISETFA
jgi:superfamily II DNA/RNA helicase